MHYLFFSEKWDGRMTSAVIYPMKYECKICNDRALFKCEKCGGKICEKHMDERVKFVCVRCSGKR